MSTAVRTISNEDLGWVAGIFDMQGALIKKNSLVRTYSPQLTLIVESRQIEVIRRLTVLSGTSPEERMTRPIKDWMRKPCSEHCPEPHSHASLEAKVRPLGRWTVSGAGAGVVLHNVMAYMQTDRGFTEFKNSVLFHAPQEGSGTGAVVKSLRRLYYLGWKFPPEFYIFEKRFEEDP